MKPPRTAEEGYDGAFTSRLYRRVGPILARILRLRVGGLENIDRSRPGILAANHNAGLWGILDPVLIYHAWHNLLAPAPGILSAISEETVFKIPLLRTVAAKTGLKAPSVACLESCLEAGHWVLVTPGANTDQLRPVWMRNRVRFQKSVFVNGRRILRNQTWYLDAALRRGLPVYPVSISGTHEMTPILLELPWLYRWSGLARLRRGEDWPGYPLTVHPFLHGALLGLSPWASSPPAWALFLLLHLYFDPLYSYPLFPFQVKIHVGEPIVETGYATAGGVRARQEMQREVHRRLVAEVERNLVRLDSDRWWVRLLRWFRPRRDGSCLAPVAEDRPAITTGRQTPLR